MVDVDFDPARQGYQTARVLVDGKVIAEFSLDKYKNYHDYFEAIIKLRDRVERKQGIVE